MKKYFIFKIFVLLTLIFSVQAKADGEINNAKDETYSKHQLTSYLGESGWVVKRRKHYEYGPAVLSPSSSPHIVHMWFCGGGGKAHRGYNKNRTGDVIWYTRSDNYGHYGSWTTPKEVIRPSHPDKGFLDDSHACDPSVVESNGFFYVMYTGAPIWKNQRLCPTNNSRGCDNRIFVARVSKYRDLSNHSHYQKLVNNGECAAARCFQWQNNDANLYAPVPIIRNEIGPVWRKKGTGTIGFTTPQTASYGIGQPSQINDGTLKIWFTHIDRTHWNKKKRFVGVKVWETSYSNLMNPYGLQRRASYSQKTSNTGNEVNYDVAFDSDINRYVAVVAQENGHNNVEDERKKPCVHTATYEGARMPRTWEKRVISNSLIDERTCFLTKAEPYAHNASFLRDERGYLAKRRGSRYGRSYNWVYYGTRDDLLKRGPHASHVDINRVPFTLRKK